MHRFRNIYWLIQSLKVQVILPGATSDCCFGCALLYIQSASTPGQNERDRPQMASNVRYSLAQGPSSSFGSLPHSWTCREKASVTHIASGTSSPLCCCTMLELCTPASHLQVLRVASCRVIVDAINPQGAVSRAGRPPADSRHPHPHPLGHCRRQTNQ
jgi:hypothetical protein